jgi:hypothetical protein
VTDCRSRSYKVHSCGGTVSERSKFFFDDPSFSSPFGADDTAYLRQGLFRSTPSANTRRTAAEAGGDAACGTPSNTTFPEQHKDFPGQSYLIKY